jgi:hypothetical protein
VLSFLWWRKKNTTSFIIWCWLVHFLANQHHILKVGLWREYLAVVMLLESHYTLWQGTRTKMRWQFQPLQSKYLSDIVPLFFVLLCSPLTKDPKWKSQRTRLHDEAKPTRYASGLEDGPPCRTNAAPSTLPRIYAFLALHCTLYRLHYDILSFMIHYVQTKHTIVHLRPRAYAECITIFMEKHLNEQPAC